MGAGDAALVDDGDRRLAERLRRRGVVGQELAEPDRARHAGRAAADEEHAHVDPLVLARLGRRDEFAHPDRGWIVGGAARHGGQDTLPRDATRRPPLRHRHAAHAGDAPGDGRGGGGRRRLGRRPHGDRARGRDGPHPGKGGGRVRPLGDDGKPGRGARPDPALATRSSSTGWATSSSTSRAASSALSGVQPASCSTATAACSTSRRSRPPGTTRATSTTPARAWSASRTRSARRAGWSVAPERIRDIAALRARARHATAHGRRPPVERGRGARACRRRRSSADVDSVSVCFSKGLGAPVGSAVAGDADLIQEVRRNRKLFGGGMRQAGIIAAGALHALRHHVERLADDHRNARRLAEGLAGARRISVDPEAVETNIVLAAVPDGSAEALVDELAGSRRAGRLAGRAHGALRDPSGRAGRGRRRGPGRHDADATMNV